MFTGIVREVGALVEAEEVEGGLALVIRAPATAGHTAIGDSVAVDGVCLTATAISDGRISFHAVPETLARTTFGDLEGVGANVNVEPALRAGDPLGGHFVQGHVDAIGRVRSVEASGEGRFVWIDTRLHLFPYCVVKGSITVDGVALTIADLDDEGFAVALVPHTLSATTFSNVAPGRSVNIEFDVLAKYVERLIAR
jgi:riboflavin synthase alpha subunit